MSLSQTAGVYVGAHVGMQVAQCGALSSLSCSSASIQGACGDAAGAAHRLIIFICWYLCTCGHPGCVRGYGWCSGSCRSHRLWVSMLGHVWGCGWRSAALCHRVHLWASEACEGMRMAQRSTSSLLYSPVGICAGASTQMQLAWLAQCRRNVAERVRGCGWHSVAHCHCCCICKHPCWGACGDGVSMAQLIIVIVSVGRCAGAHVADAVPCCPHRHHVHLRLPVLGMWLAQHSSSSLCLRASMPGRMRLVQHPAMVMFVFACRRPCWGGCTKMACAVWLPIVIVFINTADCVWAHAGMRLTRRTYSSLFSSTVAVHTGWVHMYQIQVQLFVTMFTAVANCEPLS